MKMLSFTTTHLFRRAMSELPTPNVIPQDYTFEGWYTAASGGTKVELSSNVADLLGGTYSSELNLYAHWHIGEDVTNPKIQSITLTHEESGSQKEYVSGSWTEKRCNGKIYSKRSRIIPGTKLPE